MKKLDDIYIHTYHQILSSITQIEIMDDKTLQALKVKLINLHEETQYENDDIYINLIDSFIEFINREQRKEN